SVDTNLVAYPKNQEKHSKLKDETIVYMTSNKINQIPLYRHVALPDSKESIFRLKITEINSPTLFWAQYTENEYSEILINIKNAIKIEANKDSNFLNEIPNVDYRCLAPDPKNLDDQNLFRAIVLSNNPKYQGKVKLFYVDYGWIGYISPSNLRAASHKIFSYKYQSFQCRLVGLESNNASNYDLKKINEFEKMKITYLNKDIDAK
ncbi:MAG: Tudor domain-containing protein 6, partial [Paramarteilia canceri]